ncbi:N-acetyl-D-glucosamine ABC transport system, sugar-binding protein [Bacillus sp. JCM 19047]|nr:N-acetyl-D-glucosamine ABC transport system, sugar-binding protein [Bacillus sp. JCM 19047]
MGSEQLVNEGYIQQFEQQHPNVKVNLQAIPWGNIYDNLLTAVASGSGPDVVQMGTSYMADFASTGSFLSLDEYVEDYPNLNPDHFFDGAVDSSIYNGELVAVPWYVETRVLFYRTDLLADVGFPEGPDTWEELYEASKALYDRGDGLYAMTLPEMMIRFRTFLPGRTASSLKQLIKALISLILLLLKRLPTILVSLKRTLLLLDLD